MEEGAKNHTAAGRKLLIRGSEVEREAPQFMKPMPMGRVLSGGYIGEVWRRFAAFSRWVERSDVSVPKD